MGVRGGVQRDPGHPAPFQASDWLVLCETAGGRLVHALFQLGGRTSHDVVLQCQRAQRIAALPILRKEGKAVLGGPGVTEDC